MFMFLACWLIVGFVFGCWAALTLGDVKGVITVGDIGPILLCTIWGPLDVILFALAYLESNKDKVLFDFNGKNEEL